MDGWISNVWLLEDNPEVHGQPACVLPLMAAVQEHQASTPVRPVLEYRNLSQLLRCNPGAESPVCEDTLRRWRQKDGTDYDILDVSKAYLQVRVAPHLLRYQTVVWQGKVYVMDDRHRVWIVSGSQADGPNHQVRNTVNAGSRQLC